MKQYQLTNLLNNIASKNMNNLSCGKMTLVTDTNITKHFIFGGKQLNVLSDEDGVMWFMYTDIRDNIHNSSDTTYIIQKCCPSYKIIKFRQLTECFNAAGITDKTFGRNGCRIICESELYKLLIFCNGETSDDFRDWLCDVFLPSRITN